MRILHLWVTLLLISFSTSASSSPTDSLNQIVKTTQDANVKVDALIELSKVYLNSNLDSSLVYANSALAISIKNDNKAGTALSYKYIGIAHYFSGDPVEAYVNWNQALSFYREIDDKTGIANMLNNIGVIYFNESDYTEALEYYLQSLKFSKEVNDTLRILTANQNIGAIYTERKNNKEAKKYLEEALIYANTLKDKEAIATIALNLSQIYINTGDVIECEKYQLMALESAEIADTKINVLSVIANRLIAEEKIDSALIILNSGIDIANSSKSFSKLAQLYLEIAKATFASQELQKSIAYSYKSLKESKESNNALVLKSAYSNLASCYSALGKFDSAYKYGQLSSQAQDKMYEIQKDEIIRRQVLNFSIEEKQNEINQLVTDGEIQELTLEKEKTVKNFVLTGMMIFFFLALIVWRQKGRISKEKKRSDALLLNILPMEVAEELKEYGESKARSYDEVSVIFTDFSNFTKQAEKMSATELVEDLNLCFKEFDEICTRYKLEKIKTIGDSYMACGGLPLSSSDSVLNSILAGLEMQKFIKQGNKIRAEQGKDFFQMRCGIHTGPLVAGIVGVKKFQYDIWGDTVNTASRMESYSEVGEVNISQATYERARASTDLEFINRGALEVKGKGMQNMWFVRATE